MRVLGVLPFAAVTAVLVAPAQAETAYPMRIETRPIYGATVTIEHGGARLSSGPPTDRLIVNPDRAPLC